METIKKYTSQGRKISGMKEKDILDYLGIADNMDKNYKYFIVQQAEEIEKQYSGKEVDYCIKEDYYSYMLDTTNKKILGETQDLVVYG